MYRHRIGVALVLLLCCGGCWGRAPTAHRVKPDNNDEYYPSGQIHFVEQGRRERGVLVTATPGFGSPFEANWVTKLVPLPPSNLQGPVWTGRAVSRERARAIASLPHYRNARDVALFGNGVRFRFRELSIWVLGTEPLVFGLPDGAPRRSWLEFALKERVGRGEQSLPPLDIFLARYAVDGELGQPLSRLVVFPNGILAQEPPYGQNHELSLVRLAEPLTVDEALDALAAAGDPLRLGTVEKVSYYDNWASEREHALARRADDQRLANP